MLIFHTASNKRQEIKVPPAIERAVKGTERSDYLKNGFMGKNL